MGSWGRESIQGGGWVVEMFYMYECRSCFGRCVLGSGLGDTEFCLLGMGWERDD